MITRRARRRRGARPSAPGRADERHARDSRHVGERPVGLDPGVRRVDRPGDRQRGERGERAPRASVTAPQQPARVAAGEQRRRRPARRRRRRAPTSTLVAGSSCRPPPPCSATAASRAPRRASSAARPPTRGSAGAGARAAAQPRRRARTRVQRPAAGAAARRRRAARGARSATRAAAAAPDSRRGRARPGCTSLPPISHRLGGLGRLREGLALLAGVAVASGSARRGAGCRRPGDPPPPGRPRRRRPAPVPARRRRAALGLAAAQRGQARALDDVAAVGVLVDVGRQLGERLLVLRLRVGAVDGSSPQSSRSSLITPPSARGRARAAARQQDAGLSAGGAWCGRNGQAQWRFRCRAASPRLARVRLPRPRCRQAPAKPSAQAS